MRVCSVFLLSFMLSSGALSQDSTNYDHFAGSFDVIYGQKFVQNEFLGSAVNNLDQFSFGQAISTIGLGFTALFLLNRKYNYPGNVYVSHVIPQKIAMGDSISGRVSGFNIALTLVGWDVFRERRGIDLILGAGLKTGRIRLFGDSRLEQVNPYFSPIVSVSPRFNFGKIALQFRAKYELEITRSSWRKVWFSTSPKVDLGPMKSTGLTTSVSLGWILD